MKMELNEIYTKKFLDKVPKEHYLLNIPIEKWNDRDWIAWGEVVNGIKK